MSQIMHLGKHLYSILQNFYKEVNENPNRAPFSFLLFNLKNDAGECMRAGARILCSEMQFVCIPKKD